MWIRLEEIGAMVARCGERAVLLPPLAPFRTDGANAAWAGSAGIYDRVRAYCIWTGIGTVHANARNDGVMIQPPECCELNRNRMLDPDIDAFMICVEISGKSWHNVHWLAPALANTIERGMVSDTRREQPILRTSLHTWHFQMRLEM
jgi:hypothetical protein